LGGDTIIKDLSTCKILGLKSFYQIVSIQHSYAVYNSPVKLSKYYAIFLWFTVTIYYFECCLICTVWHNALDVGMLSNNHCHCELPFSKAYHCYLHSEVVERLGTLGKPCGKLW